jgi:hypothetical protein
MRAGLYAALVMGLVACSHANDAKRDDTKAPEKKAAPKVQARRDTPRDAPNRNAKKSDPRAPKLDGPAEPMTTSKTTKEMFKPAGLMRLQQVLQQRLVDTGEKNDEVAHEKKDPVEKKKEELKVPLAKVEGVDQSGELDARTQEALRAFQRAEKLPETGLPDYETLRRLGIKPDELYHHEPPAKREGVVE